MLQVGDRVVISEESEYYGQDESNPDNSVQGTITEIYDTGGIPVDWDNGESNGYSPNDLIRITEKHESIVKEDVLIIHNSIDEILEIVFPGEWERTSSFITIRFPEFVIRNSRGKSHTIKELYTKFVYRVKEGKLVLNAPSGLRALVSKAEYDSNYCQSHLNCNFGTWSNFCLGSSEFSKLYQEFLLEPYDAEQFEFLMYLWHDFVRWESLEGTPYRYIDKIKEGTDKKVVSEDSSWRGNAEEIYKKFITQAREFIKPFISYIDDGRGKVEFDIDSLKYNDDFHKILIDITKIKVFKQNNKYILDETPNTKTKEFIAKKSVINFKGVDTDAKVEAGILVKEGEDIVQYYAHPAIVKMILNKFKYEYTRWWNSNTIAKYSNC